MILRLATNVPTVLTFKYDQGQLVDSVKKDEDGNPTQEWKCTLTDDSIFYMPKHVGEIVQQLGIRRNMPAEFCKAQAAGQKTITWRVRRIEETQRPGTTPTVTPVVTAPMSHQQVGAAAASPRGSQHNGHNNGSTDPFRGFNDAPHTGALPPSPAVTRAIVNDDGTVTRGYSNGHAAPVIHTKASAAMAGALIASIDAWRTAMEYAASKGFALTPTSEDVRTVANTLVINAQRAGGAQ